MDEREDRIVYVCGCGHRGAVATGPACLEIRNTPRWWAGVDVALGVRCSVCNQPIQAINIDRLLRIVEGIADVRTGDYPGSDMLAHPLETAVLQRDAYDKIAMDAIDIMENGMVGAQPAPSEGDDAKALKKGRE
jgi:hypothetical protein